jgi:hypothetical protein
MAIGQSLKAANVTTSAEKAAGQSLVIQPGEGEEWFIRKIMCGGPYALIFYDGGNITVYTSSMAGTVPAEFLNFPINHDQYFIILNTSTTTNYRYSFLGYVWA